MRNVTRFILVLVGMWAQAWAAPSWQFVEIEGIVEVNGVRTTMQRMPSIEAGWIVTGPDSAATVKRGEQQIRMGENARIMLPATPSTGETTVQQSGGKVAYKVDKRRTPHFEVRTRLLSAVVKGTEFTVDADDNVHVVRVSEGRVQTTDLKTGEGILLRAGDFARTTGAGLANAAAVKTGSVEKKAQPELMLETKSETRVENAVTTKAKPVAMDNDTAMKATNDMVGTGNDGQLPTADR